MVLPPPTHIEIRSPFPLSYPLLHVVSRLRSRHSCATVSVVSCSVCAGAWGGGGKPWPMITYNGTTMITERELIDDYVADLSLADGDAGLVCALLLSCKPSVSSSASSARPTHTFKFDCEDVFSLKSYVDYGVGKFRSLLMQLTLPRLKKSESTDGAGAVALLNLLLSTASDNDRDTEWMKLITSIALSTIPCSRRPTQKSSKALLECHAELSPAATTTAPNNPNDKKIVSYLNAIVDGEEDEAIKNYEKGEETGKAPSPDLAATIKSRFKKLKSDISQSSRSHRNQGGAANDDKGNNETFIWCGVFVAVLALWG